MYIENPGYDMPLKSAKTYLFLDTNTHLHFLGLEQIDWRKYFHGQEIVLVLAPITITELDKHKYISSHKKIRDRARKIVKLIYGLIEGHDMSREIAIPNRSNTYLFVLANSPDMSRFRDLDKSIADDNLIGSILEFISGNPDIPQNNLFLVTNDLGLSIKARRQQIQVWVMPEELQLPSEPTEEESKIKELERVNQALINRQPKLQISILSGGEQSSKVDFQLDIPASLDPGRVDDLLQREMENIAWSPDDDSDGDPTKAQILLGAISEYHNTEIMRYKKESESYLLQYKEYLQKQHEFQVLKACTRLLKLIILNSGNLPAQGVVIQVDFPPEITVLLSEELPSSPNPPSRPKFPERGYMPLFSNGEAYLGLEYTNLPIEVPLPDNPDTALPDIVINGHTQVAWKRPNIKHHLPHDLSCLYIVFPDNPGITEYLISYRIFADNLPEPVEGHLSISVQVSHSEV